jgi:hypothetical protein
VNAELNFPSKVSFSVDIMDTIVINATVPDPRIIQKNTIEIIRRNENKTWPIFSK